MNDEEHEDVKRELSVLMEITLKLEDELNASVGKLKNKMIK